MTTTQMELRFNGADYQPDLDQNRLTDQYHRIWNYMLDQDWHTLQDIADYTGDPPASISAQLRHMRKKRFGRHAVNKRRVPFPDSKTGLYEYQLIPNSVLQNCNMLQQNQEKTCNIENTIRRT